MPLSPSDPAVSGLAGFAGFRRLSVARPLRAATHSRRRLPPPPGAGYGPIASPCCRASRWPTVWSSWRVPHDPQTQRSLPSTPAAPKLGREVLAQSTCPAHPLRSIDDAVLLTTEAITNAVMHGLPPVSVAIDCLATAMENRVRDAGQKLPTKVTARDLDEGGRGMLMVEILSESWGIEAAGDGKEIWFRVTR